MKDEYAMHFDIIGSAYRLLSAVPLQAMLDTVNRADSIGPILDPTAYMKGAKNLGPQREVLEAAIAFTRVLEKHSIAARPVEGW